VARFEVSNTKAGSNAVNTPMWQFKGSTTSRARVFEIALSISGPTAPTVGPTWRLVRSTALGTSTATQAADEQDPGGGAPTALLDTAWSANPTLAAVSMRLYGTPNTIGSGIVWTWPDHRPLIVPISNGIVIVNNVATGAALGSFNCSIVFEE
jgi:hypothetical protein